MFAIGGANTDYTDAANLAISDAIASVSATEADALTDQLAVQEEVLSAAANTLVSVSASSIAVTADRLASLRTGTEYALSADAAASGFATGDGMLNKAFRGKFFHSRADQDGSATAAGYESDTTGLAAGVDMDVGNGMRVGGAFTFSTSDVEGDGAGQSSTDIDSYQLLAYGDKTIDGY